MSTSCNPQTDDQTKKVNNYLEMYLECFSLKQPKSWSIWIPWAKFWYNTSYHSFTQTIPFEIAYGQPAPVLIHYQKGQTKVQSIAQALVDRDEALRQLKYILQKAQNFMKWRSDKHKRNVNLTISDQVYVKLRPHRQTSPSKKIYSKSFLDRNSNQRDCLQTNFAIYFKDTSNFSCITT